MISPERMAEIKKVCACVPFIDNGNGVPETMQAMRELIEDHAAKDARIAELEHKLAMLIQWPNPMGVDAPTESAKPQPPEAGEGSGE